VLDSLSAMNPLEILILALVVVLIFASWRLPAAGRALGRSMREFKDAVTTKSGKNQDELPRSDGPGSS